MELFSKIKSLADSITAISGPKDIDVCIQAAESCEAAIADWYATQPSPDYRLSKLLKNLIFYLKSTESEISLCSEMLTAIAKTTLRTADYDINIRENPDKIREWNKNAFGLCKELRYKEKLPVDETSDKPYDITIFMATYNQLELTKLCLDSVFRNTDDVSYELYLIDNGSSDGTYEYFKDDNRIKLIRLTENTGLLLALQIFYESGIDQGRFWLYMNNDVVVTPRWASNMLKCIKSDPSIASVMPTTNRAADFLCIQPPFGLYDIDEIQNFGERYNVSNSNLWQDWLIYYGFVLLVRPSVRRLFGYYEDCFYFPFYYSDGDIVLMQAKAGYRSVQARDTYIHHFDGGHTVLQDRRSALAAGEKIFYDKYGFFPTDLEKNLPKGVSSGVSAGTVMLDGITGGVATKVLFLGASRVHPQMQLQCLNKAMGNKNTEYYAADTMEFLGLEQYGDNVRFCRINNWYEIATVFDREKFDAIVYTDDIMKLRNPEKFLTAIYSRLNVNGKLYFQSDNTGCLLAMNYILMSHRTSPRDGVRIRKNSTMSINSLISLLTRVGFVISTVEDVFYNETFTYANLDTIENYRDLYKGSDPTDFERNIKIHLRNITVRKPGNINTANTLEQLLYMKKEQR